MNYKGIVDWLQEDDFVLMGFSKAGEISLMEKVTGREVNDLPSFLIATVLPIAKKKVIWLLKKEGSERIDFLETIEYNALGGEVINASITSMMKDATFKGVATGKGATGEYAMVNAVENFIVSRSKEKVDDKG